MPTQPNEVKRRFIAQNLTDDAELAALDSRKVDKVLGKQLSTEDFTTAEKTKLSILVGRVRSRMIGGTPILTTGTAFITAGEKFIWIASRNTRYKNGVLMFNAIVPKNTVPLEVRIYDATNAVQLGTSGPLTANGRYVFPFNNPTTDAVLEVQIRQSGNGSAPSVDTAVIEFDTI